MNFLLNKIDTDLRRQVYDKTRNGIIHRKTDLIIYKDAEKNKKKTIEDNLKKEDKEEGKIIVEATKNILNDIKIEGEKDIDKITYEYGSFLDIKK